MPVAALKLRAQGRRCHTDGVRGFKGKEAALSSRSSACWGVTTDASCVVKHFFYDKSVFREIGGNRWYDNRPAS